MSVFSNPSSSSREQAAAYSRAVIELLGSRDALEVLESTPREIERAIEGLSDSAMVQAESDGKWSIRDVVQHLNDSEVVWSYRIRMALAQDKPPIHGYDQDLWASRLHYDTMDVATALSEFAVLRRANVRLLRQTTPEERARVGVHVERGEESVAHMMKLEAGHDLLHLNQIARIRKIVAPAT